MAKMSIGIFGEFGAAHEIHQDHPGHIKEVEGVTITLDGLRLRFSEMEDGSIEMRSQGAGRMTLQALGGDQFLLRPVKE